MPLVQAADMLGKTGTCTVSVSHCVRTQFAKKAAAANMYGIMQRFGDAGQGCSLLNNFIWNNKMSSLVCVSVLYNEYFEFAVYERCHMRTGR